MPNEVYEHTRERLADIVSARAAQRVLDDAMRHRGYSPDSISSSEMKRMLMGPVLRGLEAILPRDGLKRNLREVGNALEKLSPYNVVTPAEPGKADRPQDAHAPDEAPQAQRPSFELEIDEDRPWSRPAGFIAPPTPVAAVSPEVAIAESGPELEPHEPEIVVVIDPVATPEAAPVAAPPVTAPPPDIVRLVGEIVDEPDTEAVEPISAERLKAAVIRFARIGSVQQVAALRANGEVVEARGNAVDLSSLGLLIVSSLGLLRRHGTIRSYYLNHDEGQMFLFPVGRDTIVVVGRTNLNLGAVFTALAALEEEL